MNHESNQQTLASQVAAVIESCEQLRAQLSRQVIVRYDRPEDEPPAEEVGVEIERYNLRWEMTTDGRIYQER